MTICKVGHTMESAKFWLQFQSASQRGVRSAVLEERTDWTAVMEILLQTLQSHHMDLANLSQMAAARLEQWAVDQPGGDLLQLRVSLDIKNRHYYRQDQNKCLWLNFSDLHRTCVVFNVRRKTQMSSLRNLAAAKVAGCVARKGDLDGLEVPRDVTPDMREAFEDSWRVKYINTSPLKRKITDLTLDNLRNMSDCPFCGRRNFKKILSHVMRNENCHLLYKSQLNHNFVLNNCFW